MKLKTLKAALAVGAAAFTMFAANPDVSAAGFQEYPIGDEQVATAQHFKVALVYFQPIDMVPAGMMLSADKADIHIETDIHATQGNDTGFGVGEWIPYLTVHYTLTKTDTGEVQEGVFMPMNADDGPHYGANIKMMGAGHYRWDFSIDSPLRMNYGIHTDKETGVKGRFWTEPVKMSWEMDYVPRKW